MGNEKTKYSQQEILNYAVDDTVSPPLIQVGLRSWNGTSWVKGNALDNYKCAHTDNSSPAYYGFIDTDGNWYILRATLTGSVTAYEYAAGSTGYPTNWNNRASLTYASYDSVF